MKEDISRADFATTVSALKTQLAADGWTLVAEIDLGVRLAKKSVNLPGGLVILELTSGGATIPLLKNEATRYVAGLMPCSVSVYGMDDGRVVHRGAMAELAALLRCLRCASALRTGGPGLVCPDCGEEVIRDAASGKFMCPVCGEISPVLVQVPHAFKLLLDEIKSMCVSTSILTDDKKKGK